MPAQVKGSGRGLAGRSSGAALPSSEALESSTGATEANRSRLGAVRNHMAEVRPGAAPSFRFHRCSVPTDFPHSIANFGFV
jgi:hypothetical protein